eukprot:600174-Hanusia_phi.AAC.1
MYMTCQFCGRKKFACICVLPSLEDGFSHYETYRQACLLLRPPPHLCLVHRVRESGFGCCLMLQSCEGIKSSLRGRQGEAGLQVCAGAAGGGCATYGEATMTSSSALTLCEDRRVWGEGRDGEEICLQDCETNRPDVISQLQVKRHSDPAPPPAPAGHDPPCHPSLVPKTVCA